MLCKLSQYERIFDLKKYRQRRNRYLYWLYHSRNKLSGNKIIYDYAISHGFRFPVSVVVKSKLSRLFPQQVKKLARFLRILPPQKLIDA
jgi:hypothetical protein